MRVVRAEPDEKPLKQAQGFVLFSVRASTGSARTVDVIRGPLGNAERNMPCYFDSLTSNSGCSFFCKSRILSSMSFGSVCFSKMRVVPRL